MFDCLVVPYLARFAVSKVVVLSVFILRLFSDPFINFVKIWLNELLGFMVFGALYGDSCVIGMSCDLYIVWEREMSEVIIIIINPILIWFKYPQ